MPAFRGVLFRPSSPQARRPILGTAGVATKARDHRLDLFRGLALLFIFVDHIPGNPLGWITIRNYGFSDATEIFVFISGYAAARAYGTSAADDFLFTSARILRRCWQLYLAHIFLFVIFATHVASVTSNLNNPLFAEEMNVTSFLHDPETTLLQVLLLRFRPVNMDVLPLYIVLLLAFPLVLPALKRWPWLVLGLSVALWQYTRTFDINLRTYPGDGVWFFDPSGWQILFVLGAVFALKPVLTAAVLARSRYLDVAAALYLVFAFYIVLGWKFPVLAQLVPGTLERWMYPIDKTALDPLRLIHFLCIAYVTIRLFKPDTAVPSYRLVRPVVACGRHSLEVFCLGTILSLVAHIVIGQTGGRLGTHLAVAMTGIVVLAGTAAVLDWYKRREQDRVKGRGGASA